MKKQRGLSLIEIMVGLLLFSGAILVVLGLFPALENEIAHLEEVHQVVHISSIERIGLRRGRKEGRQEGVSQGLRAAILQVVTKRWNLSDPSLPQTLDTIIDEARLLALLDCAIEASDPDKWKASLAGPAVISLNKMAMPESQKTNPDE